MTKIANKKQVDELTAHVCMYCTMKTYVQINVLVYKKKEKHTKEKIRFEMYII